MARQWPDWARLVLAAVVLVMLTIIWLCTAPGRAGAAGYLLRWATDIDSAGLRNAALDTAGAPQQQVAKRWLTNDLVQIGLAQNTYLAASRIRNGARGAVLALGLGGWAMVGAAERLLPRSKALPAGTCAEHQMVPRSGHKLIPP